MFFVIICIICDGATKDQKAQLISGVTDLLVKVLDKNPATTHIMIEEVDTDNWGFAGEQVSVHRQRAADAAAKKAD